MDIKNRIYLSFGGFFPRVYREHVSQMLRYAGDYVVGEIWLGSGQILGLLILLLFVIAPKSINGKFSITFGIFGIIGYLIVQILVYLIIYFKVEDRTRRIEDSLPDALQLTASNLNAGMTPFQALKLSSRKEFGPLAEEIQKATSQALGTEPFSSTIMRMGENVKSEVLDRALKLFTNSMKAGGHLAKMLEDLAADIAETKQLKNDLLTSTKTYSAFIFFTIIIGTPLLLAISIYFVEVVGSLQESSLSTDDAAAGIGFSSGKLEITPEFLTKVAITMLILTSILASMMIGVIREGQEKYGLRYAPPVIFACLFMFYAFRYAINVVIGSPF